MSFPWSYSVLGLVPGYFYLQCQLFRPRYLMSIYPSSLILTVVVAALVLYT